MKVDLTYAKLPWHVAMARIMDRHRLNLEPCLVIRGDNPEKTSVLSEYIKSIPNVFYIKLGKSTSIAYFAVELLSQIESSSSRYRTEVIPHETVLFRICKKMNRMSGTPTVIFDRAHHINTKALFRVLRLINALEGKVLFMFLIPEEKAYLWIGETGGPLQYFLKIVDSKYVMYD